MAMVGDDSGKKTDDERQNARDRDLVPMRFG